MQNETWQQLFALETRDAVYSWHKKLFNRDLNARRIAEITSAAKQAREFFRNAEAANNSVRPLLGFYGVASLSRAGLLLLKPGTGEADLVAGHGLSTYRWKSVLDGEISNGLAALGTLQVETCSGLFTDFIKGTENQICIHVNSSAVDWRICYDTPTIGSKVSLNDLLSRLPDLARYLPPDSPRNCAQINSMKYSEEHGFSAEITSTQFIPFSEKFISQGYSISPGKDLTNLQAEHKKFSEKTPQFIHTYTQKTFGTIPGLHISSPFEGGENYSQLSMTYMLSYFLGMLTRYFPTQWIALANGAKGDQIWPALNAAQKYVELSFPELMLELILDRLDQKNST
ncbi:MAG: YaaC family protein [Pseudomonas sp.]|nr:YaaC family protein [Pseudomonas sp.]